MMRGSKILFFLCVFVGLIFIINLVKGQQRRQNVVFIIADQWRAQATGYYGDPNVITPNLDRLAKESINFTNAVSCEASCTPFRASLMTGQYPTTHGLILNDILLDPNSRSLGKQFKHAGYNTAYVGKWHLNGPYRLGYISKEHRQGFEYWKVMNCTHNYMNSYYYGNTPERKKWDGYDAHAQAKDVCHYIKKHSDDKKPFIIFLSWGPPHPPYREVPQEYLNRYDTSKIILRPNVPDSVSKRALKSIQGYYANMTALDEALGWIRDTIKSTGIEDNTIVIFTSDHGDMVGSHGEFGKSVPYDEAIRTPFLIYVPGISTEKGRKIAMPINTPDIMPTLLSLCRIPIPCSVEGHDFSKIITGEKEPHNYGALIESPTANVAGREFRGVRTSRYTYVADLTGAWMLFDNLEDPYQMHNLVNDPEYNELEKQLKEKLQIALRQANDKFLPGWRYLERFGIFVTPGGYPPFRANFPSIKKN